MEYYMTADELGYIRPGFHITVNSITIPEDRRPSWTTPSPTTSTSRSIASASSRPGR